MLTAIGAMLLAGSVAGVSSPAASASFVHDVAPGASTGVDSSMVPRWNASSSASRLIARISPLPSCTRQRSIPASVDSAVSYKLKRASKAGTIEIDRCVQEARSVP